MDSVVTLCHSPCQLLTPLPSCYLFCTLFNQGERHADEESSEDEWSDAEDTDTPIDSIDPFVVFADTVKQLQTSAIPRFQVPTLACAGLASSAAAYLGLACFLL